MSRFEPRPQLMEDVKVNNTATSSDKDVEGGAPPSYPLQEAGELVVGVPGNRFVRWIRAHRIGRYSHVDEHGRCSKRSKIFRAIKFLLAGWVVLSLIHLALAGITAHKAMKSLQCKAITPGKHLDGLTVTVPVRHSKHLIVHDTLSGGDTSIVHDDTVAKGTVQFSVTFANDTKPDAVYDGCVTTIKRNTAVGLIPREKGGERAKISTFTIRVPSSLTHPSVSLLGKGDKHISLKKLQKLIQWWRKHQGKKSMLCKLGMRKAKKGTA